LTGIPTVAVGPVGTVVPTGERLPRLVEISNTAADHIKVGDRALEQLRAWALDGEIVARVDGAGATHEFTRWCRDAGIQFSVGAKLTQDILQTALPVEDHAWNHGLRKDGPENP